MDKVKVLQHRFDHFINLNDESQKSFLILRNDFNHIIREAKLCLIQSGIGDDDLGEYVYNTNVYGSHTLVINKKYSINIIYVLNDFATIIWNINKINDKLHIYSFYHEDEERSVEHCEFNLNDYACTLLSLINPELTDIDYCLLEEIINVKSDSKVRKYTLH